MRDVWKPMDSARKDGSELLLLLRSAGGRLIRRVGWWENDVAVYFDDDGVDPPPDMGSEAGWTDGFWTIFPEAWTDLPDVPAVSPDPEPALR